MTQQKTRLPVTTNQNSNLPVVIDDLANIVLASSGLTGIVVSALGKALRSVAVSGVKEITLTITDSWAEITLSIDDARGRIEKGMYERKKHARIERFEFLAREFDDAMKRAPLAGYLPMVQKVLESNLEQAFIEEMSKALKEAS